MKDNKGFTGYINKMVADNEKQYGQEIREKYGDDAIERSNAKFKGMTPEQHTRAESLSAELGITLKAAHAQGDPAGELAQKACELHKQWLCIFWESYTKEAHMGITQMYVDDTRFAAYYDNIVSGGAVFLRDAVAVYTK